MNDFLQSLRNGQAEKPRTPKTRKNYDNSYHYSSGPRFHSYGGGSGSGNFQQPPRNPQMKRQPAMPPLQSGNQMPAEDQGFTLLADLLDTLTNHVETLVKNQEYMVTVQERTADLLDRQAAAIEQILVRLGIGDDTDFPAMETAPAYENHYVTSQDPEEEFDGTVDELLELERQKEEMAKAAAAAQKASSPVLRKRRKVVEKQPKPVPAPAPAPAPATGNAQELMGRDEIMEIINGMRAEGATYDQVAKRLIELGQPTFSGRGEWHAQTIHRLCSRK